MFLNNIKNLLIKKIVSKSLSNVKSVVSNGIIKTVGIVFDESYFYEREALIQELIKQGIKENDIKVLAFKNKIKKNEVFDYPTFSNKDLSWTANFGKSEVVNFINEDFDMLINYYDVEKNPLLLLSNESKASFKVGFFAIDKRLNHFMINVNVNNYAIFIDELFKYLKILNKI
jgi:hypothetical protein